MEQVFSQQYSAEGEVTTGRQARGPMSGLVLALCIPVLTAIMVWAAVAQPEVYLPSLMWGQLPL